MIIQTGADLRRAREQLGWTQFDLALALKLEAPARDGNPARMKIATRIREMENGTRDLSGPISVAVEAFTNGFRAAHFDEVGL